MSDQRLWLVERDVDGRNLVTLTYATRDGERVYRRQAAASSMRQRGREATAAVTVDDDATDPVDDEETRERYAAEASRVADDYDPDEPI